jgi:hypothetical protein
MKTLNFITRTILAASLVLFLSVNVNAQKSYHNRPVENAISELNKMANQLIENYKLKFDLKNTVSVSELELTTEATAEKELNEMIEQLSENSKFDVRNTISVIESGEEFAQLDQETDALMANLKFDVNNTISVTEAMEENSELSQLTDTLIANVKFDVNQTNSVNELNEENNELNQLLDAITESNARFHLQKTNSILDDQFASTF